MRVDAKSPLCYAGKNKGTAEWINGSQESGEALMAMITLQNGILTVSLSTLGAELTSVLDQGGTQRIWQGAPGFWSKHAPVLFPIAGALKENRYALGGKDYTLPKHGFARECEFRVEEQSQDAATFLLTGEMTQNPGFPFTYAFRVRFTLLNHSIRIDYSTENLGDVPFWYGVGAHEGYDCPGGYAAHELAFDQDTGMLTRYVLRGGLLTGGTEPVPMQGNILPIRDQLFENDTLILLTHGSRGVTLQSKRHPRKVRVDFSGFDVLLIWAQMGAPYVCIEPWSCPPDFMDTDHDITKKPGMTRLAGGEAHTHTHTITFL